MVGKIIAAEVEETTAPGGNRLRLLAHPERTGNKYCQVALLRIPPGHKFPKHLHPSSDDVIYVLKGRATFTVGGERMELSAGELVVIPEGVPHSALNPASEDAEMLVFQSPMPKFEFLE
jgi:quercetin dioxygenase-like cupin family protein